jgi:hypothetical protein
MKKLPYLLGLLLFFTWLPAALRAQEPSRAAVVVRFANDQVASVCVPFDGADISAYDALRQGGFDVEANFTGLGGTVCRINGTGCPPGDCWCQCAGGAACTYWSYWRQNEGSWQYATAGATSNRLSNGDVDGWSWGPGSVSEAISPPTVSFGEVCRGAPNETPVSATPMPAAEENARPLLFFGLALALLAALFLAARRWRRSA